MGLGALHKKKGEVCRERYSVRLKDSTYKKIKELGQARWHMADYIRDAIEEAVNRAYDEKILKREGEAA